MAKYFISYATADDDANYQIDFANFANMNRYVPGVPNITLFVAISKTGDRIGSESAIIKRFKKLFANSRFVTVGHITTKSNIGRDFSSHALNIKSISKLASESDFVLCLNRSAYGPLADCWYESFINQYNKFPNIGLCGITINFLGHPKRPLPGPSTHVQSYAFLAQMKTLQPYVGKFPAEKAVDRLSVITEGEIGLSQLALQRGLGLTCLAWPDHKFTLASQTVVGLPTRDIKKEVSNLPFIYRYNRYEMATTSVGWKLLNMLEGLRRVLIAAFSSR